MKQRKNTEETSVETGRERRGWEEGGTNRKAGLEYMYVTVHNCMEYTSLSLTDVKQFRCKSTCPPPRRKVAHLASALFTTCK